jgi:hypothetical protein
MMPVDPRTDMPNTDLSAFQKLVQLSRKPTDTEDPAREGKGDNASGRFRHGYIHLGLLAEAKLMLIFAKVHPRVFPNEFHLSDLEFRRPFPPGIAAATRGPSESSSAAQRKHFWLHRMNHIWFRNF